MLAKLLLLFTVVPLVELALLIPLGQWMGLWPTLALVFITGVAGAWLGKQQGARAWRQINQDLASGKLPGDSILDGLSVLLAGAFLVTPGVLTDIAGMTLLIPTARQPLKRYIKNRFEKSVSSESSGFMHFGTIDPLGQPSRHASGDVIDMTNLHSPRPDGEHDRRPAQNHSIVDIDHA